MILIEWGQAIDYLKALHLLGYWPISPLPVAKTLLLTAILFTGPLFEKGVVEGQWRSWVRFQGIQQALGSWIGWRNYVAVFGFHVIFPLLIPSRLTKRAPPGSNDGRIGFSLVLGTFAHPLPPLPKADHLHHPTIFRHRAYPPPIRIQTHTPTHAIPSRIGPLVLSIRVHVHLRLLRHLHLS